jgi:hypothetical protein
LIKRLSPAGGPEVWARGIAVIASAPTNAKLTQPDTLRDLLIRN